MTLGQDALPRAAERLRVCGNCAELYGDVVGRDGVPLFTQRARGTCEYAGESWHEPMAGLPPPAGDFPTEFELCYCCAAIVIPSGSKFSSFYCDACRDMVQRFNASAGRVLLPLGRHSIMNRIALRDPVRADDAARQEFVASTMALFDRIGRLCEWRRVVVSDRVARCTSEGGPHLPLMAYLAGPAARVSKEEMFRQLCRYFGVRELEAGV